MSGIKQIAIAMIISGSACGLFYLLVPNNNLEKILKFSLSLFFIISICTPFFNNDISFDLDLNNLTPPPQIKELSVDVNNGFIDLAIKKLEDKIQYSLEKKGVEIKKVVLSINKLENDSISINKATIYLEDIKQKEKALIILKNEFDIKNATIK